MSKKKATMTLKDFHGGSIPSDLTLPCAPGVSVRPADRGGFDRPTSWGNPIGRSDPRLRPASAGSVRNFDDKSPFLSHGQHIGRYFDEDERKPLDGGPGPRRTVGDESVRAHPSRVVDPKLDHLGGSKVGSRPASTPGSQYSSSLPGSTYAGRVSEINNVGMHSQSFGGNANHRFGENAGQVVSGSYPNAWGVRKEKERASAPSSAPDAATKLAHASALEKVTSGRWHSKLEVHQTEVEAVRHVGNEKEFHYGGNDLQHKNSYNAREVVDGADYNDAALPLHAERSVAVDVGIRSVGKEMPPYDVARAPTYMESKIRNPSINVNGVQPLRTIGTSGASDLQPSLPSELSERPKLKLLPRSKQLDDLEPLVGYKQGYQQSSDAVPIDGGSKFQSAAHPSKPASLANDVNRSVERQKLNPKSRSDSVEQTEGNGEIERNALFGGARPREVVLKERGEDEILNNYDSHLSSRVKQETTKIEAAPRQTAPARYNGKPDNARVDHRSGKTTDRRDQRADIERTDMQRRNWRNENWRNNRDNEKHNRQQQQQVRERPPSPETWRKPVEDPKPATSASTGLRYGKVASAVELAQAFSKSVSDPAVADRISEQKGPTGRGQMPFSRLTGPTPRPQINGY